MPESRPLRSLRYRQCPDCKAILRASEFSRVGGPANAIAGQQQRRCPQCGFVGMLMSFMIVAPPAEPDEWTPD
jgi:hypothetical protein